MNDVRSGSGTLDLIMNHRSIRAFADEPVPEADLLRIIRAAQMASTSSNMQAYSVIRVTDRALRAALAEIAGRQQYVADCPEFLVWCADMERLRIAAGFEPAEMPCNAEAYTIAAIDAALAAQNAAIAAESLGYGICYIGAVRNDIAKTAELLGLPERVVPLFGMCIGRPAQEPLLRPRLPVEAVLHENRYDASRYGGAVAAYDGVHAAYLKERSGGRHSAGWSEQMRERLSRPPRRIGRFLRDQGFDLAD
ncbi:MAG: NADPH-dependent oxidoreductase [Thermobacillus sp. ZCTH02-B1]|uniref:oxygen-insensitive NADPH nitroreductase n=1 Tax=Thermobacillus sp. ZCTH02-B1 TaxID=1858795 RepID=UPI000B56A0C4|nr:oxygen-insensitive NADPH nitroreductase [Thermobacillus sp. ZCTH02-B1]OUM95202.1 MAG: NADPH-dependent oxidoreductase [Thermobacillus sp. ZCTH02-B1]